MARFLINKEERKLLITEDDGDTVISHLPWGDGEEITMENMGDGVSKAVKVSDILDIFDKNGHRSA